MTGIFDGPDDLEAARRALGSAGFDPDAIWSAGGEEALATVDVHGQEHGLLGRLKRWLEHYGEGAAEHHAAETAVEAGGCLVAVSVSDEATKNRAASILREAGGHRLRYWGRWEIEELPA